MIISAESPLRRIPDNLDPRQACFLDGIRLSVEMCDVAYTRLSDRLWDLATGFGHGGSLQPYCAAELLLDAWSVVDSTHRLRSLLDVMPRFQKSGPLYQIFTRATAPASELRNAVQHLREEMPQMAEKAWPVLGVLSWLALVTPDGTTIRSCALNSGRMQSGQHRLLNPAGQAFAAKVDHVTLECKEQRVSLSEFVRQVEKIVRPFEQSLAKQFPDCSSCGSGLVMCMDMAFPPPDAVSTQADAEGAPG